MYKNVLEGIDNIAIWPVVSFVIFFLFFMCLLWYVFTINKDFIHRMKNMPLDDEKKPNTEPIIPMKILLLPFLLLMNSTSVWAQGATQASDDAMFSVYLIIALVVAILLLVSTVAIVTFRAVNMINRKTEEEKAKRLGVAYVPSLSIWAKFWMGANAMVPLEQEKEIELAHSYDGIRELDNHLPPWWTGLFYACIVFSVVYMIAYHASDFLPLSKGEYENELAAAEEQARIRRASQPAEVIDLNTLTFVRNEEFIASGKQQFASNNCGSCHRLDGGGNSIGPNLTDAYWLHGGSIKDVFTTINQGVVEKAMPAWGKVMSQKSVRDLAFYVMSLQGSNPKDGKKPQGDMFKQPDVVAPADSIKISMIK